MADVSPPVADPTVAVNGPPSQSPTPDWAQNNSMWDYVLNSANTTEDADGDYIYSVARSPDSIQPAATHSHSSDESDRPRSIRWDLPEDEGTRGDDRSDASFLGNIFAAEKHLILTPQSYATQQDLGEGLAESRQDNGDTNRQPVAERSGPSSVVSGASDSSQPLKSILRKKLKQPGIRAPSPLHLLGFRALNDKRIAIIDKGLSKKEKFARLLRNRRIKMMQESEPKFKLGQYDDKEEAIFDATTFFPSYDEEDETKSGSGAVLSDEDDRDSKDLADIVGSIKSDEEGKGSDESDNSSTRDGLFKVKSGIFGLRQVASLISGASSDNSASVSSAQKEFNLRFAQDPNCLNVHLPPTRTTKGPEPFGDPGGLFSDIQRQSEGPSPTSIKDAPMAFEGEGSDSFFHDLANLSPVDLFGSGSYDKGDREKRGSREFWRKFFMAKDARDDEYESASDDTEPDAPADANAKKPEPPVEIITPALTRVHREIKVVRGGGSKGRRSDVILPVLISVHQKRDEEAATSSLPTHPRELRSMLLQADMALANREGRGLGLGRERASKGPVPLEKGRLCESPDPPTKTVSITRPSSPGSMSMVSVLSYPGSVRSRFGRTESERSKSSNRKPQRKRRPGFRKMNCVPCAPMPRSSGSAVDHFPEARALDEDQVSPARSQRQAKNDLTRKGEKTVTEAMLPQTITVATGPVSFYTYEHDKGCHMDIQYEQYGKNACDVMRVRSSDKFRLVWGNTNNVCVKVEASTISDTDCIRRQGDWAKTESLALPIIPGGDIVGRVFKINGNVKKSGIRVGDRVMSLVRTGGNSRYAFTSVNKLVKVPDSVDAPSAVCLLETYLSAFQALHIAHKPGTRYRKRSLAGKTVLIAGATTNIGIALIELAKHTGASSIYIVCKEKQRESATKLGVSPLSRRPQEWITRVKGKVDILFDANGESRVVHELYSVALNEGGHYVFLDKSSRREKTSCPSKAIGNTNNYLCQRASRLYFRNYDVFESWEEDLELCKRDLQHLVSLLEKGHLKPKVVDRLPLTKVARAHEVLDSKRVQGILVCEPWMKSVHRAVYL